MDEAKHVTPSVSRPCTPTHPGGAPLQSNPIVLGSERYDTRLCAMYVQEATEHDNTMLKGSHDALDVLLIMAGLFSAVLTAFLIESYKLLQPDPQDETLSLLRTIAQRLDTNQTIAFVALPSPGSFVPPLSAWLVNALWFFSLVSSLSAAFVAMLAKQWLQAYALNRHGRVETHARQRHYRYSGFLQWMASEIIYTLPVLLQFSFSLFFIGLDILVWSVNPPIGYLVIVCTASLLGFYLFTTFAPLFDLSCPFRTPFSLHLATQARRMYFACTTYIFYLYRALVAFLSREPLPFFVNSRMEHPISHAEREHVEIERMQHSLDVGIIEWLVGTSHQEEIVNASLVAISSLRPNFSPTKRLRDSGAIQLLVDRLIPKASPSPSSDPAVVFRDHAANSIQYLASLFCSLRFCTLDDISPIMSRFSWRTWIVLWGDFTLNKLVQEGWDLDALSLYLCASTQCDRAQKRRPNREFNVMVELLNWHSSGKAQLTEFSVWALVDSIATWGVEFEVESLNRMRPSVTACLLKLLGIPYSLGDPVTRAVGVALGVFVLDFGKTEIEHYRDEENRRRDAQMLLIRGVVDIMKVNLHNERSRYALNRESFEAGGMVICKLLVENNAPAPWPNEVSTALLGILEVSKYEGLTCKVLETFRRLLSFDAQSSVPDLLSSIIPFFDSRMAISVQVKATQVIGEMMHWRQHRQAILHRPIILQSLVSNLESASEELSNSSSLALIDISRESEARELMVSQGLGNALKTFFSSNRANRHNLAHWSWLFVGSSWGVKRLWRFHNHEFKEAFLELSRTLEGIITTEDDTKLTSSEIPQTPSLSKRDLRRIIRDLKELTLMPSESDSNVTLHSALSNEP